MAKISGIYVEIRGDSTQLRKDLATARQHVTEQATGMSNALNNALSPQQIKQNVNGIVRNLNTLANASKLTGKEFGAIGADLKEMQKLTGMSEKAFRDLQSRMLQTSAAKAQEKALQGIARAAGLSAKEVTVLGRQMGVSASSINAVNGAARSSASSMTMLGSAAKTALGFMSVYTVIEFARAVMDAGLAMDSLQRSFVAVTGSQAAAGETLRFLREESGRLGQNFYALAPEFKNVMAAARGTAMEGENVRKMFSAIAGASTALGLSADDTHGTLRALQQMMSKGKIQAEELRGQLGERLPGALNLMAKAMGVSTAELNKMMEDGKLLADEALPKLTAAIEEMYGAAAETAALESAQAAVNRLSQAWTDFKVNLFDNENAVAGINAITNAIKTLTEYAGLRSVSDTFAQGAGLADVGLIDWDAFKQADFLTRQRMVDEFLDSQRVAAKHFTSIWAEAEQQNLESYGRYNDRREQQAADAATKQAEAAKKANEELRKLTQTAIDKLKETRDGLIARGADRVTTEKWYNSEVAKLDEATTKKFLAEQKKQLEAHKKAREAMRKNAAESTAAIDKWMEDYEQRQIDAVADGVAERKKLREDEAKAAADAAKKIAEEQEAAAQKVMDRIQEGTADVFYDMFQNIGDGWQTLWENMKSWALRTLAELAARAATVQIVVPIMTSMTGTSNATQAVQALTGGQNGFSMSNLSSLVSPGSMLSKVPGMNYVTGLLATQLPGTTMLSGGALALAGGGTAGGSVASLAAAQNLAGMTGGLSIGSALGMGSLGGLGYSLLGGSLGLPHGQYTGVTSSLGGALGAWGGTALAASSAGATLGATAGSVLPVVGTIAGAVLGGLAGSLFGEEQHSPSVIFNAQSTEWGSTDSTRAVNDGGNKRLGFEFHTKDGASTETGVELATALEEVAANAFGTIEGLLGGLGDQYVEMLQGQVIEFGRKVDGAAGGSWDFGSDMDFDKLFEQYSGRLQDAILAAAEGAFTAAGRDIADGDSAFTALSLISGRAADAFKDLQDTIRAGVQSGDVEAYAGALQSLQSAIQAINATWDAVNQAADDLVKPPTAYEAAVRQANAQFDEWISALGALGFAQEKIDEIEAKRVATLARLNAEMGPLAESEAARLKAQADAELAVEVAKQNLVNAYKTEAAELSKTQSKWEDFAASLKKWRESVLTGSMSPLGVSARAALIEGSYTDVLRRAQLGDEDAISALQGVASEQLIVSKDAAASAEDYARAAIRTLNEVESVESLAYRHAGFAKQQLEALTQQVSQLVTINESVLSVEEAIRLLASAQSAITQQAYSVDDSPSERQAKVEANTGVAVSTSDPALVAAAKVLYQSINGGASTEEYNRAAAAVGGDIASALGWDGSRDGLEKLRQIYGFASGGMHPGGLRLVGENGPELEVTGPSRIWSAEDTRSLLSGGGDGTSAEVRALREDLQAIGRALAKNTMETAKLMRRWDGDGMPETRSVA
jgi:tape measure domain-containing protein